MDGTLTSFPDALVGPEISEGCDFLAVKYEAGLQYNHGIKSKLNLYL